ncbi:MAG: four-helix bundle copper-binding protein [Phycisphaerales bacterium]
MRDARDRMGKGMGQTILDCHECSDACRRCLQHCLRTGGMHAEARHIRALCDCAEACQFAASFLGRESEHSVRASAICAEACDACALSCERVPDDEEMRHCAATCRRCAHSCRDMAGMRG